MRHYLVVVAFEMDLTLRQCSIGSFARAAFVAPAHTSEFGPIVDEEY